MLLPLQTVWLVFPRLPPSHQHTQPLTFCCSLSRQTLNPTPLPAVESEDNELFIMPNSNTESQHHNTTSPQHQQHNINIPVPARLLRATSGSKVWDEGRQAETLPASHPTSRHPANSPTDWNTEDHRSPNSSIIFVFSLPTSLHLSSQFSLFPFLSALLVRGKMEEKQTKNCEHELLGNWYDRLVHANSYLFLRCFLYNSIIIIVFIINLPHFLLSSNFFFFLGAMLILSLSLSLSWSILPHSLSLPPSSPCQKKNLDMKTKAQRVE